MRATGLWTSILMMLTSWFSSTSPYSRISNDEAYGVRVEILESSKIEVYGRSSINKFRCDNEILHKEYSDKFFVAEEENEVHIDNAFIELPVSEFDCGIRKLTKDFKDLVEEDEHPIWTIKVLTVRQNTAPDMYTTELEVHMAGRSQIIFVPMHVKKFHNNYLCTGTTIINIHDFDLYPQPKLLGMVKVDELVTIQFELALKFDDL